MQSLIRLATAVPERGEARGAAAPPPLLARLGTGWLSLSKSGQAAVAFIGEATLSLARMLTGRAQLRRGDLFLLIQQVGAQALPIVALISILVGLILAFVGSVQLKLFGAQIFVANLVAIGMTREMGAMMAAIIMAGRTGAAFAAQLGTMQVNEEIDALKTLGVDPMDFLVLPRMIALILMMPLLTVYANVLGIFGGVLVGVGMLDITPTQYWNQTVAWLRPADLALGVGKSVFLRDHHRRRRLSARHSMRPQRRRRRRGRDIGRRHRDRLDRRRRRTVRGGHQRPRHLTREALRQDGRQLRAADHCR